MTVGVVEASTLHPDRLRPLYAIAGSLRPGMTRHEVLSLIGQHRTPDLQSHFSPGGSITLWVHYGIVDSCSTTIGFSEGRLTTARTAGEDGRHDLCPRAPPNIRVSTPPASAAHARARAPEEAGEQSSCGRKGTVAIDEA